MQLALKKFPAEVGVPERGKEDKTDEMLAISDTPGGATWISVVEKLGTPQDVEIIHMDGTSRFVEAVSFAREAEEFVFTGKFGKIVARVPLKEIGDIRRVKDDEGGPTPGIA